MYEVETFKNGSEADMPSPLIREMRLRSVLRELRDAAGLTGEEAGERAGLGKLMITRLENGAKKPQLQMIMKLLPAYGVARNDPQFDLVIQLASEALERGWWDHPKYRSMDDRAKIYADLESGASSVLSYQMGYVPGFLQTGDYIATRTAVGLATSLKFDAEGTRAGRLRRQAELIREGGPRIEVIVEETVIRRAVAMPTIMADQLEHFIGITEKYSQVTIQVLPADCDIADVLLPGAPFDLFSFEDPGDGRALLISAVVQDMLIRQSEEIDPYLRLFDRLRKVAHPADKSASLIQAQAAVFRSRAGRKTV